MSIKVILNDVTFSYAHVFKPKEGLNPGEASKYSVCVLIDKTNAPDLAKFNDAVKAAIAEGQTGANGAKFNPAIPSFKMPLRDGDLEKPDRDEYAGKMFFNCSAAEDRKPEVVNKAMQPLNSDSFYSGCKGRISVGIYPFVGKSVGVAVGLNNIQKTADGERFGGGSSAAADFGTAGEDFNSQPAPPAEDYSDMM